MRAAVLLGSALGICAWAVGCGDGGTGPGDQAPQPVLPPTPTVAFASKLVGAPESGTAVVELAVTPASESPITVEILRVAGFGHCLEPSRQDLAGITDLELCHRDDWPLCRREDAVIPELRQGDFQGLSQLERLTVAGVGLTSLWWLELSGNPIDELPPGVFSSLSNLSGLAMVNSALTDLPPAVFVGLSKLRALDLRANPGTPFGLPLQLVRTDDEDFLAPGPAGGTRVAVRAVSTVPQDIRGVEFEVADPIVLFARRSAALAPHPWRVEYGNHHGVRGIVPLRQWRKE